MNDKTIRFRLTLKDPKSPLSMRDAGGGFYVPEEIASQLFRDVEMLIQKTIQDAVKTHREKKTA